MKSPLFTFPSYRYEINDWQFKKKGLLKRLKEEKFIRTELQTFETDRQTNNKSYVHYFQELIEEELNQFCQEAKVRCSMTDCWAVRYKKDDYQITHNHKSWGFSGILYVEYDEKVHTPTCFIAPWQDPRTDRTSLAFPSNVREGTLFIAPSSCLHFVNPVKSNKPRVIVSFDLLPTIT